MIVLSKDELTGVAVEVARLRPNTVFCDFGPPVHVGENGSRKSVPLNISMAASLCIAGRNAWQTLRHVQASWGQEAILISFDFCFDKPAVSWPFDGRGLCITGVVDIFGVDTDVDS